MSGIAHAERPPLHDVTELVEVGRLGRVVLVDEVHVTEGDARPTAGVIGSSSGRPTSDTGGYGTRSTETARASSSSPRGQTCQDARSRGTRPAARAECARRSRGSRIHPRQRLRQADEGLTRGHRRRLEEMLEEALRRIQEVAGDRVVLGVRVRDLLDRVAVQVQQDRAGIGEEIGECVAMRNWASPGLRSSWMILQERELPLRREGGLGLVEDVEAASNRLANRARNDSPCDCSCSAPAVGAAGRRPASISVATL